MGLTLKALPNPVDALFSGRVDVASARYSIGRAAENDWVISDPKRMISKRHCLIERRTDGYRVVDISTNGVSLNGKPVDRNGGSPLRDGDEIELSGYRFKVGITGVSGYAENPDTDDPSKPRITAILHDVAPVGPIATSRLPGVQGDILPQRPDGAGPKKKQILEDLGWDGPPLREHDVIKPSDVLQPYDREFINRSEQVQTDRLRIDLPRPKQIIPDDWYLASESTDKTDPKHAPVIPRQVDRTAVNIIPVENIAIEDPSTPSNRPGIKPTPQSDLGSDRTVLAEAGQGTARSTPPSAPPGPNTAAETLFQAFCDGAGIGSADLNRPDLLHFFHNVGRALAVTAVELQNLQESRTKTAALLDSGEAELGRTPWIYSLSGEDRTNVARSLVKFLAEAEPRELEMMRTDFQEIRELLEQIPDGVIAFVENLQQALSLPVIEKNARSKSQMLPALRNAAMWKALVEHSGLFVAENDKISNADLLKLLHREFRKKPHG